VSERKSDRKTEKIHNAELHMCSKLFRQDADSSPLNLPVCAPRAKGHHEKCTTEQTLSIQRP